MNILHLSAIKLVFLRLRKSKAIVYNVQKIACNWCHNHLLFDMVQHVKWPYDIFMIQVTHCLIWSDMWNSHMIFVWYMLHSLFDMSSMWTIIWYLCDMNDTHWSIWSSMWTIAWYLCDMNDTHYLIWSSMWTIIIYNFCVIQMTLTIWYGSACELS